jgi:hypothetical protein
MQINESEIRDGEIFKVLKILLAGCWNASNFRRKWLQQKPVFSKKTGFSDSLLDYKFIEIALVNYFTLT